MPRDDNTISSSGRMDGLHTNHGKSEIIKTNQKKRDQPICVRKPELEYVDKFTQQGSKINAIQLAVLGEMVGSHISHEKSKIITVETDENMKQSKAAAVFRRLDSVWKSRSF